MKRTIAALLAVATVAYAGIEVLGIEVLSGEQLGIEVLCTEAPLGSYVEAVMMVGSQEVVVDVATVDSATGLAYVIMPAITSGSYVALYDSNGVQLGIEVLDAG